MTMTTEQQHLTVDLHGYPVWQAVKIAEQKIKEARESGCSHVTFSHGSPGIRHHQQARSYRRGGIKGELRGELACGACNAWVLLAAIGGTESKAARSLAVRPKPTVRQTNCIRDKHHDTYISL